MLSFYTSNQHPFVIKALDRLRIERAYLNIIKPVANIMLNTEKISTEFKNKTRVPSFSSSNQYCIGSSSWSKQTREGNQWEK